MAEEMYLYLKSISTEPPAAKVRRVTVETVQLSNPSQTSGNLLVSIINLANNLGTNPDPIKKSANPTLVTKFVDVVDKTGEMLSFISHDECALGRVMKEECPETSLGMIKLPRKASAADSQSPSLPEGLKDERVLANDFSKVIIYYLNLNMLYNFRFQDSHSSMDIKSPIQPVRIDPEIIAVDIITLTAESPSVVSTANSEVPKKVRTSRKTQEKPFPMIPSTTDNSNKGGKMMEEDEPVAKRTRKRKAQIM